MRTGLLLLGLLAMFCGSLIAAETTKAKDEPVDLIRKATLFGIGPVGFAGTISDAEKVFEQTLKQKDAKQVLIKLLGESTPEGQMNALVGLKKIDKPEFESRLKGFKETSGEVRIISGGIVGEHPASERVYRLHAVISPFSRSPPWPPVRPRPMTEVSSHPHNAPLCSVAICARFS